MDKYDLVLMLFAGLGLVVVVMVKTKLHQKVLSWSAKKSTNTNTPTPTTTSWKDWMNAVRKNSLFVGLTSLVLLVAVISIAYGGLGWMWIKPKLFWSALLIIVALAVLPGNKTKPETMAKRFIWLAVIATLIGAFGFPPSELFAKAGERLGISDTGLLPVRPMIETNRDITVQDTTNPEKPLVLKGDQWSKTVWLNSDARWTVNSQGNRPFWIRTSGDEPQLHDPKNGKFACFDAGRANVFKSADGKDLGLYFRRK